MRVPGATFFSTTSVGELKNTIESLQRAQHQHGRERQHAEARSRSEPGAVACVSLLLRQPFEPETFDQLVDAAQLVRLAGQRPARVAGGVRAPCRVSPSTI